MRRLMSNCPNCGGVLDESGYCPYCETKVRFANEIDITSGLFGSENVELMIHINQGDETILLPVIGKIRSINIITNPEYGYCADNKCLCVIPGLPEVDISFCGVITKIE